MDPRTVLSLETERHEGVLPARSGGPLNVAGKIIVER